MKYAALDFELGNANPISACSVGVSVFEDFVLRRRCASLIRPPFSVGRFHWGSVRVHGIDREDVDRAPLFDELWPRLRGCLEGSVIVCHNAAFDTAVLCGCLEHFGLSIPQCRYVCTVKVSQAVWPGLENHRLNTVAEALGIPLRHHEAGSDAFAAGKILLEALRETGCADAEELSARLEIPMGVLGDVRPKPVKKSEKQLRREKRRAEVRKKHKTGSEKEML